MSDFKDLCKKYARLKKDPEQIKIDRRKIKNEILKIIKVPLTPKNILKLMTRDVIFLMFSLYDKYFFDNELNQSFLENDCKLSFCLNTKCFSRGGQCKYLHKCITLEISPKVIVKAFESEYVKYAGNVICKDMLECFQLIFEHELVHAIMFGFCLEIEKVNNKKDFHKIPGDWNGKTIGGHNKTFMSILNNRFGQTDPYHGLSNRSEVKTDEEKAKKLVKIGSKVSFPSNLGIITAAVTKKNPKKCVVSYNDEGNSLIYHVPYRTLRTVDGVSVTYQILENLINGSPKKPTPVKMCVKTPDMEKVTGSPHKIVPKTLKIITPKRKTPTPSPKRKTPSPSPKRKTPSPSPKRKTPSPKRKTPTPTPKTSLNKLSRKAGRKDKFGKIHNGKDILEGECKFPFKYKGKEYRDCIDTGKGPWCPTTLNTRMGIKTWGYCE